MGVTTGAGVAALADTPLTAVHLGVAAFSALAPDLDHGNSRLTRRLSHYYRGLRWVLTAAPLGLAGYAYRYAAAPRQYWLYGLATLTLLVVWSMREETWRSVCILAVGLTLLAAGVYTGETWLGLLGAYIGVCPFLAHRSWTHTLWAVALWYYIGTGAAAYLPSAHLAAVAAAAYASHLAGDSLTKRGLRWLYPLWNGSLGYPLIRSGKWHGHAVETAVVVGYAVAVVAVCFGERWFG